MPKLSIVIASVREQRAGGAVAAWFSERARGHGKFEIEVVDLKQLALPLLDEPNHPMKRQYQHEHTKAWSRAVAASDAFVFVVPEYNHSMPPALLNALDYLYVEWNYKPVGFVSYGGLAGGTRSVQMALPLLATLKLVPLVETVALPWFNKQLRPDGTFDPGDVADRAIQSMLDELLRWADALKPLRA